ncbi:MAG: sensor histidine kinase [Gemmatimonadaceae bacterium]
MRRLPQFIRENAEAILVEWDAFALTLPMAATMDMAALRDHAREMLGVIARDLETVQTPGEQVDKAEGKADAGESGPPSTAAQEHGAARAGSGFTVAQMLSELRALRASVIRLWTRQHAQFTATDVEDITRFNEAIDQAIAESVTQFSDEIVQTKDRFLAILSHDLRNPLGAIMMSSSFIIERGQLGETDRGLVTRIASSARRMNEMVGDVLDFTRTRFGGDGIPIVRDEMDLQKTLQDVVLEVGTRYPKSIIQVEAGGALSGQWDSARLTQALTNLVCNAVQHGAAATPITVAARGSADDAVISVHNQGPVIPAKDIGQIFKVGVQAGTPSANGNGHLGLGLFIVERIVAAHGGTIDVQSAREEGTTFTVHLPREAARAAEQLP